MTIFMYDLNNVELLCSTSVVVVFQNLNHIESIVCSSNLSRSRVVGRRILVAQTPHVRCSLALVDIYDQACFCAAEPMESCKDHGKPTEASLRGPNHPKQVNTQLDLQFHRNNHPLDALFPSTTTVIIISRKLWTNTSDIAMSLLSDRQREDLYVEL